VEGGWGGGEEGRRVILKEKGKSFSTLVLFCDGLKLQPAGLCKPSSVELPFFYGTDLTCQNMYRKVRNCRYQE